MREFGFELRLCAHLEAGGELVARQLGASVRRPGSRVVDVLLVEPGPGFGARSAITPAEIPDLAIEADVGVGRARSRRAAFGPLEVHPETAREVADRAVEVGFFERERRGGRSFYRQTARYPGDWFGRLVAVENKPDLGTPGDLASQLRRDVALGLVDEVVLATGSYVTGAHLNRLPEEVGVWRFVDGDGGGEGDHMVGPGEVEVVREPTPLPVDEPGVEIVEERPGRTDVRVVGTEAKARQRRRMAERAYGKGWRTFEYPACARVEPDGDGLPHCQWAGRPVQTARDCGEDCPGHEPGDAPDVDVATLREAGSSWVAAPEGRCRTQSALDRFS